MALFTEWLEPFREQISKVDKGAEGSQLSELERKVIAKILKQCLSRVRRLLEKSERLGSGYFS